MCLVNIKVNCPHCHQSKVVKNGTKSTGMQNFLCKSCGKQFQREYFYRGADPVVKAQVKSALLHGSGIRDCTKVFGISPNATLRLLLKEGAKVVIRPQYKFYPRIQIDELHSFVHQKRKKVWIFYAYAPDTKEILAITMGKRSTEQLRSLMRQLTSLKIEAGFYCTDAFRGFTSLLPYYQHLIGKQFTARRPPKILRG